MGLSKCRLGNLIKQFDERNSNNSIKDFRGLNIDKIFMPTVANTEEVDATKYKVVRNGKFVFSGMQTGRDQCIRLGLYDGLDPILVSPAYETFEVIKKDLIIPEYLFMIFLRKEMDRYGAFLSDSSIRANLDWDRFSEIELDLPPIPIQQKYVDVYNAMVKNQQAYEKGLEELKLTCDAYIENLRRNMKSEIIGKYIREVNIPNGKLQVTKVQGVNSNAVFMDTKAKMEGVELSKYKIVSNYNFAYNPSRINLGSIALFKGEKCIVSPMYEVFEVIDNNKLLPEYLMLWFSRKEFQRYTWFYAAGSVRDTFDFNLMQEVKIPIPDINIQNFIVKLFNAFIKRKDINERLKAKIKDICPVLIRGSIEEGKKDTKGSALN